LCFFLILKCGNVRWLKKLVSAERLTKASTGLGEDCSVESFIIDEAYLALQKARHNADRNYIAEVFKVLLA